jgi:SAM-dependent methyltransferase
VVGEELYRDSDLARFYDLENPWADDFDYCRRLARGCTSVLDLGCGTGLFAATLASEGTAKIVGIDPARAMLDIAATRPGGERVLWLEDDARSLRLSDRFDLVVLTGHVFQVFLTEEDRAAVLSTIAHHLGDNGRFVFDSRNPAGSPWRKWNPTQSLRYFKHPSLGDIEACNDARHQADTGIVSYDTFYRVVADDRRFSSQSKIAFPSRERIASQIEQAGLVVSQWLGDWTGTRYSQSSPEIIPVGALRGA